MKGLHGIVPVAAMIAVMAAVGAGVGAPTALAEMQHRGATQFVPGDLPYGVMKFGENFMGMYQPDKGAWNGELIRMRETERTRLQQRCPTCTQQIQELEQEQNRIREQERIRQQTQTQTGGSGTGSGTQGGTGTGSGTGSQGGR